MKEFKHKNGILVNIEELNTYLNNFSNIEFHNTTVINMITNTEGGISGGSSTVLQMLGSRDEEDLIILTFLPDELVWIVTDTDIEDDFRFDEFLYYLIHYSQDVKQNNINWEYYGCQKEIDTCMKKFINAIGSICEEGIDSDSINEFQDEFSGYEVFWSDCISDFSNVPSGAEDEDYWNYAGYWILSSNESITILNEKFIIDEEEKLFNEVYDYLSDKIVESSWHGDDLIFFGAGLLRKNI